VACLKVGLLPWDLPREAFVGVYGDFAPTSVLMADVIVKY
jgi:hypothetical protein